MPAWLDRRDRELSWTGFSVSVALTFGLFVAAFMAMQTVGVYGGPHVDAEKPIVVRLPVPVSEPRPIPPPPRIVPRVTAPTTSPRALPPVPDATAPAPVVSAPTSDVPPPRTRTDTAGTARSSSASPSPVIPLSIGAPVSPYPTTPYAVPRTGAPSSASGVTIGDRTANTAQYRDSMLTERIQKADMAAWMRHEATGRERAEMEQSRRDAAKVAVRTTTAGSRDVHIPQGEGRGGEGAVGGAGSATSIPLPLFSSGPSAKQRKKNEAIDADNQARLRRLQDLARLRRDSVRLDSLRRDSVARGKRP